MCDTASDFTDCIFSFQISLLSNFPLRDPPASDSVLFLMIPQRTDFVSLCDTFRQIKHTAVPFSDPMISAHGNIAQLRNFLIGAACLLPCLYKRTVMKIERQLLVRTLQHIHLKNPLSRFRKQRFFQTLQACGDTATMLCVPAAPLLPQ